MIDAPPPATASAPVATIDPTPFIAACWIVSATVIGGLMIHAWLSHRSLKKRSP